MTNSSENSSNNDLLNQKDTSNQPSIATATHTHLKISPVYKYKPEYNEILKKAVMMGMSFEEVANKIFNVPEDVLKQWMVDNPAFAQAAKNGADMADMMVVDSLYKIAVGYDKEEEVALPTGTVTITRHHEPNIHAIKYWLNNKQSEKWKNKLDQNLSGEVKGGVVLVTIDKDDEEL